MALTQVQPGMLTGNNSAIPTSTAVGTQALNSNSAANNTAVGYQSLFSNTTGDTSTAVGYRALYSNTTGTNCNAFGKDALYSSGSGVNNTAIGDQAGRACTGNVSTFVGANAGVVATGSSNTFIGCSAGEAITTGSKNTIIGRYNGNQDGQDFRTSSNVIVISDGDGKPKAFNDGSSWYFKVGASFNRTLNWDGSQLYPSPDNTAACGNGGFRWTVIYAVSGTINTSDANQKQQIRSLNDTEKAVATRIKGLIKAFKFNDAVEKKGDGARIHVGVIAQEVQAAFEAEGLDPTKYAMFCSDTWYEIDGKPSEKLTEPYTAETEGAVEVTRLGVRYDQLLAFVISTL